MGQSNSCTFNCMDRQDKQDASKQPQVLPPATTPPLPADEAGKVLARIMETSGKSTRAPPVQPYWAKRPKELPDFPESPLVHEDSILNRQERRLLESMESTPAAKYATRRYNHFNVFTPEVADGWEYRSDNPNAPHIPEVSHQASNQGSYRDMGMHQSNGSRRSTTNAAQGGLYTSDAQDPFNPRPLPQLSRPSDSPLAPASAFQKQNLTSSRNLQLLLSQDPTNMAAVAAPLRVPPDLEKISMATRSTNGTKSHEPSEYVQEGLPLSARHN